MKLAAGILGFALLTFTSCASGSSESDAQRESSQPVNESTAVAVVDESDSAPSTAPTVQDPIVAAEQPPGEADVLPLSAIDQLRSDYQSLLQAQDFLVLELASRCMVQLGFERPPAFVYTPSVHDSQTRHPRLLELDPAAVESEGYEATPAARMRAAQAQVEDPRERAQRELSFSDEWAEAWSGPVFSLEESISAGAGDGVEVGGTSGCLGSAQAELSEAFQYDELVGNLQLVERLWGSVFDLSASDVEYIEAQGAWIRCMATQGYDFPDEISAFAAGDALRREGRVGDAIAQAVVDSACQRESRVVEAYESAWDRGQAEVGASVEALGLATWHRENFDALNAGVLDRLRSEGLIAE